MRYLCPSSPTVEALAPGARSFRFESGEGYMMEQNVKQVIVIRKDLGMRRGKEISQGAHASIAWLTSRLEPSRHYDDSNGGAWVEGELSDAEWLWVRGDFRKLCVIVST